MAGKAPAFEVDRLRREQARQADDIAGLRDQAQSRSAMVGPAGPAGPPGADGAAGATGATGPAGPGLPAGGTAKQVPRKASGTDYDVAWGPIVDHGTYTPALTNVANVAASVANQCTWLRVGNSVMVGGSITLDPTTASVLTEVGISLPVASAFTASDQLGGSTGSGGANTRSGQILADIVNDRAQLILTPTDVANRTQAFSFMYEVR